jgi:hypothetical protein
MGYMLPGPHPVDCEAQYSIERMQRRGRYGLDGMQADEMIRWCHKGSRRKMYWPQRYARGSCDPRGIADLAVLSVWSACLEACLMSWLRPGQEM